MSSTDNPNSNENYYRPKMLVTQAKFDAATPEERERFNYAVDESILPPPFWVTPVSEPEDNS